jgi:hypothetical protein
MEINEQYYKDILDRVATWYYCQNQSSESEWYNRLTAQILTDLESVLGRERMEQLQGNSIIGEGYATEEER